MASSATQGVSRSPFWKLKNSHLRSHSSSKSSSLVCRRQHRSSQWTLRFVTPCLNILPQTLAIPDVPVEKTPLMIFSHSENFRQSRGGSDVTSSYRVVSNGVAFRRRMKSKKKLQYRVCWCVPIEDGTNVGNFYFQSQTLGTVETGQLPHVRAPIFSLMKESPLFHLIIGSFELSKRTPPKDQHQKILASL